MVARVTEILNFLSQMLYKDFAVKIPPVSRGVMQVESLRDSVVNG